MSRRSRWDPSMSGHARLEIPKALLRDSDVSRRDCATVLGDRMQEDEQVWQLRPSTLQWEVVKGLIRRWPG
jgi:hypothetical protein